LQVQNKTMKRKHYIIISTVLLMFLSITSSAEDTPSISPTATYTGSDGDITSSDTTASAPLEGKFKANVSNLGDYKAYYEWRFYTTDKNNPYLTRYTEDTEFTFTSSGTTYIVLYATFISASTNDTIAYTADYWGSDATPLKVTISESKLEFPNAFSPNGDGINDIYKAKDGYKSIVDFHAYIYNRWGQKIYEWTDPAGGWDGKFNGHDVKQGVYFVLAKAKGADGINYEIKRDVNLLRGFTGNGSSSSTSGNN
jgi:gliding motility-associated-like protein